jgi:hypothetical protein
MRASMHLQISRQVTGCPEFCVNVPSVNKLALFIKRACPSYCVGLKHCETQVVQALWSDDLADFLEAKSTHEQSQMACEYRKFAHFVGKVVKRNFWVNYTKYYTEGFFADKSLIYIYLLLAWLSVNP